MTVQTPMVRTRKATPTRTNLPGIPRAVFRRIVNELVAEHNPDLRVHKEALAALHEEAEKVLEERFLRSSAILQVCKTQTLKPEQFRVFDLEANAGQA